MLVSPERRSDSSSKSRRNLRRRLASWRRREESLWQDHVKQRRTGKQWEGSESLCVEEQTYHLSNGLWTLIKNPNMILKTKKLFLKSCSRLEEGSRDNNRLRCQLDLLLADKEQHHVTLEHLHKTINDLKSENKGTLEVWQKLRFDPRLKNCRLRFPIWNRLNFKEIFVSFRIRY